MWVAAREWVIENATFGVREETPTMIDTNWPPPGDTRWAYRVTREPVGGGGYKFVLVPNCNSLNGSTCAPDPYGIIAGFNARLHLATGGSVAETRQRGNFFSAGKWSANITRDSFTDMVSCQVTPAGFFVHDAYPFVFVRGGRVSVLVSGGKRYPGKPTVLRVDNYPAIEGEDVFSPAAVDTFLSQLPGASIVQARFTEWPHGTYRNGRLDATGLLETIDYCRAVAG
jgi:hypothetical protein